MQGNVLLGDQPRAYSSSQVFVQESRDLYRIDILPTFQETSGQGGYCVCVGLDQFCEHFCEPDLIVEVGDGFGLVGQQGREGV